MNHPNNKLTKWLIAISIALLAVLLCFVYLHAVSSKKLDDIRGDLLSELISSYETMGDRIGGIAQILAEDGDIDVRNWKGLLENPEVTKVLAKVLRKDARWDTEVEFVTDDIEQTAYYVRSFLSQVIDFYTFDQAPFQLRTCKGRTFASNEDILKELEAINNVLVPLPSNTNDYEKYDYLIKNWNKDEAEQLYRCMY